MAKPIVTTPEALRAAGDALGAYLDETRGPSISILDELRRMAAESECPTCHGTGAVPEHHATGEPGGYVEMVSCPDCGGR